MRFTSVVQLKPRHFDNALVGFYNNSSMSHSISDEYFSILIPGINALVYINNSNSMNVNYSFFNFIQDMYLKTYIVNDSNFCFATRSSIVERDEFNYNNPYLDNFFHFCPGYRVLVYGIFNNKFESVLNAYLVTLEVNMLYESALEENTSLYNDLVTKKINENITWYPGKYVYMFRARVETLNNKRFFYMYKKNNSLINVSDQLNTPIQVRSLLNNELSSVTIEMLSVSNIYLSKSGTLTAYMYPFNLNEPLELGQFHMVTGPIIIYSSDPESETGSLYTLSYERDEEIYEVACVTSQDMSIRPGDASTTF